MRIKILTLVIAVLLLPIISADILITQPQNLYSLGDPVSIPITVKTSTEVNGFFSVLLICNGKESEIYKEYIFLTAGEEKKMSPSFLLVKSLTGVSAKDCLIKASLNDDYVLSDNFQVSNKINVNLKTESKEYLPGEKIAIEGDAIKENGEPVSGYIEITSSITSLENSNAINIENTNPNNTEENIEVPTPIVKENLNVIDTVNNGYFSIEIPLVKTTKAGDYTFYIKVYEKDFEDSITNEGSSTYGASVKQVPTSLELLIESEDSDGKSVIPGNPLKIKPILHDQTGESIPSSILLTIKDEKGKVREKSETLSNEVFELPIEKNEKPSKWTILAQSIENEEISSELSFSISEFPEIKAEIINNSLIITNIGNVQYNKTITVKIGEESLYIDDLSLDVGESQKYKMSAPDGEYDIEIIEGGDSKITGRATLTGNVISVKKESGDLRFVRNPFSWLFVILILGFMAFMIVRKGYTRSFCGKKFSNKKSEEKNFPKKIEEHHMGNIKNFAELTLSLKGEKLPAKVSCLKIKNLNEIKKDKGSEEILKNIIEAANEFKASVYENGEFLMFILTPLTTKTFKNEGSVLKLSNKIRALLLGYNRLAKNKIEYGVSLNVGQIIAKKDSESKDYVSGINIKFMSLGNMIGTCKKLSTISETMEGEELISIEFNQLGLQGIKTEKMEKQGQTFYKISEFKKGFESEENKRFISNFVKRLEGKK